MYSGTSLMHTSAECATWDDLETGTGTDGGKELLAITA